MKLNFSRWEQLLERTTKSNSWIDLHDNFKTDNSYFRELKDMMDEVLNKTNKTLDEEKIFSAINRNPNIWKHYREASAVNFIRLWMKDPKVIPSPYDMKLFQEIFIRETKLGVYKNSPDEASWDILDMMADLHKKNVDEDMSLDKAFGLVNPVGNPVNPFAVPEHIERVIKDMIENDKNQEVACYFDIEQLGQQGVAEDDIAAYETYKTHMIKFKWTGLNEYFHQRIVDKRGKLSELEIDRIYKQWNKIVIPEKLEVFDNYVHHSLNNLKVKDKHFDEALDLENNITMEGMFSSKLH